MLDETYLRNLIFDSDFFLFILLLFLDDFGSRHVFFFFLFCSDITFSFVFVRSKLDVHKILLKPKNLRSRHGIQQHLDLIRIKDFKQRSWISNDDFCTHLWYIKASKQKNKKKGVWKAKKPTMLMFDCDWVLHSGFSKIILDLSNECEISKMLIFLIQTWGNSCPLYHRCNLLFPLHMKIGNNLNIWNLGKTWALFWNLLFTKP